MRWGEAAAVHDDDDDDDDMSAVIIRLLWCTTHVRTMHAGVCFMYVVYASYVCMHACGQDRRMQAQHLLGPVGYDATSLMPTSLAGHQEKVSMDIEPT